MASKLMLRTVGSPSRGRVLGRLLPRADQDSRGRSSSGMDERIVSVGAGPWSRHRRRAPTAQFLPHKLARFGQETHSISWPVTKGVDQCAEKQVRCGERRRAHLMVEDAEKLLGAFRFARQELLHMPAERRGLAWSAKVVRKPVHGPGVSVAPLPILRQRVIQRTRTTQSVNERGCESFGLSERISDALAGRGVLEVTGVAGR